MKYKFPAIAWAVVIFILSSVPSSAIPKLSILEFDKVIHGTIFFVFGLFVYYALEPRYNSLSFSWQRAIVAFLIVVAYGILDEFHQHFVPGRTPDVYDALADATGGLISSIAWFGYMKMRLWKLDRKARS